MHNAENSNVNSFKRQNLEICFPRSLDKSRLELNWVMYTVKYFFMFVADHESRKAQYKFNLSFTRKWKYQFKLHASFTVM